MCFKGPWKRENDLKRRVKITGERTMNVNSWSENANAAYANIAKLVIKTRNERALNHFKI